MPYTNSFSQFTVGLESMIDQLNALSNSDSFPKHNVVQLDQGLYQVEVALAGYSKSDFEVWTEENVLYIGSVNLPKDDRVYLHKGVAKRGFTKCLRLGDQLKVTKVEYNNGLLVITLERYIPEDKRRKVFAVT